MTALAQRKTRLSFVTSDVYQGRQVVVEVSPFTAAFRLKGQRTRYEMSWSGMFMAAAKLHADRARAERKARRRGR